MQQTITTVKAQLEALAEEFDCVPNDSAQAVTLYLACDRDEPHLTVSYGEGSPQGYAHGYWEHILNIPARSHGDDILAHLCDPECLAAIAALWEAFGEEIYNSQCGHHIGVWDEDARQDAAAKLSRHMERLNQRTYWDARDWLFANTSTEQIYEQLCVDLKSAGTIEAVAEQWASDPNTEGLVLAHEVAAELQKIYP